MSKEERRAAFVNWPIVYEGMDAAGLDALVAFSPEGSLYISGSFSPELHFVRDRFGMVVVPREGDPTYIVCNIDEPLARSASWLVDIRTYVEHATSPIDALGAVLEERGLD